MTATPGAKCAQCDGQIQLNKAEIREGRKKPRKREYCSRRCSGAARRDERVGKCDVCGERTPRHTRKYCSQKCYMYVHKKKPRQCLICNSEYFPDNNGRKFCSTKCSGIASIGNQRWKNRSPWTMPAEIRARFSRERTGSGNPRWSGGSPGNGIYPMQGFVSAWTLKTHQSCVCGCPSTEVQHIVSRRLFAHPMMANFAENLIGLCTRCHRRADGAQLRARRRGQRTHLLFADRLPESILDQLQRDGCVSQLPRGLDWSPIGNAATEVLPDEWFFESPPHGEIHPCA